MKNVTITMDDEVAEWARMEAARRNTSVSRLVGELLADKMRHVDAYERALQDWLSRERSWMSESEEGESADDREVLHERGLR